MPENPGHIPRSGSAGYAWSRLAPPSAALIALSIYLLTLLREVGWGDSAELALQSYTIGLTHPPGYPVYTLLGKLFTLIIREPAVATNVMSAVFTGLCVLILCSMIQRLSGRRLHAFLSSLVFAFIPVIWSLAVTTEVYNVNISFLALVLYILFIWNKNPSIHTIAVSGVVFGLSMGTSIGNVLVLPAIIYLIIATDRRRLLSVSIFLSAFIIIGGIVVSLNYLISRVNPPIGSMIIPDSVENLISFIRGDQYKTLAIHSPRFYVIRGIEHLLRFSRNLLWAGAIIGLIGLWSQWKRHPLICKSLLLAFAFNFGYFTFYDVSDYYLMVAPSYFIFSIWIAYGLDLLCSRKSRKGVRIVTYLVTVAVVIGLISTQMMPRIGRSRSTPVTDFLVSSYRVIPEGALVLAYWNEFAPLCYHHEVHGSGRGITLIELRKRSYVEELSMIPRWKTALADELGSRTIVTYGKPEILGQSYEFLEIGDNWYQLFAPSPESRE